MSSLQLTNNSHHSCDWKWSNSIGLMILLSWWQWHKWKLLSRHIKCHHFTVQSHAQTGADPEDVSGGWRESGSRASVGFKGRDLTGDSGGTPKSWKLFHNWQSILFAILHMNVLNMRIQLLVGLLDTLTDRWGCMPSSFPMDPPPSSQLSAVQITNRTWRAIITGIPCWLTWNFCNNW